MGEFFSSFLGTVFFTALAFIAGGFIGKPLFVWVNAKLPWNKK